MIYYAIKDKETGKWLGLTIDIATRKRTYTLQDDLKITNTFNQEKAAIDFISTDEIIDEDVNIANLKIVPVELKEVVDDPLEQSKEYPSLRELLMNAPIKESKPKWYEIKKDQMIRLDAIQSVQIYKDWNYTKNDYEYYIRIYAFGNNRIDINDIDEEEIIAKYNELKKLLEEV